MSTVIQITEKLVIEHCCKCGITFGITSDFYNKRSNDHTMFYCPEGHPQYYSGKSEAEELRDELAHAKQNNEWYSKRVNTLHTELTQQKHIVRAQKAAKTKIMNRVKNGVCPCCNRTFQDLQKHFQSNRFIGEIERVFWITRALQKPKRPRKIINIVSMAKKVKSVAPTKAQKIKIAGKALAAAQKALDRAGKVFNKASDRYNKLCPTAAPEA